MCIVPQKGFFITCCWPIKSSGGVVKEDGSAIARHALRVSSGTHHAFD